MSQPAYQTALSFPVLFPVALPPEGDVVVAVGENSLDFVATVSSESAVAAKHILTAFDRYVGGQAATAAVTVARQGLRARYVGVFGTDEVGAAVRAHLAAEAVDVVAIERPGARSRVAVIIVDPAGERTVYEYRDPRLATDAGSAGPRVPVGTNDGSAGPPAPARTDNVTAGPSVLVRTDHVSAGPTVFAASMIAGASVLMLDATDPGVAMAAASAARAAGIPTVIDIDRVTPDAARLLSLIDLIVVPEPFLVAFTGARTAGAGLAQLSREFRPALAVTTLGAEGSLALAAGREFRTPGFPVTVADTTGAGDAFRGGLVSAWIRGEGRATLEEVLAAANATAALNCRAVGAQSALPGLSEVEALLTRAGQHRSN